VQFWIYDPVLASSNRNKLTKYSYDECTFTSRLVDQKAFVHRTNESGLSQSSHS